jgi:hypothetical protein
MYDRSMNSYRMIAAGVVALGLMSAVPLQAQQGAHQHTPAEAAAELAKARRRFSLELEKIKALAGRWEGTTFRASEGTTPAVVTYEVTSGGSAVIERMFPGTAREMTTIYHDDSSGRLVAAHYCNAANQPRLRLKESDGERLYFVLSPDSDIKADLEGHAHELTLRLGADGSLVHDWLNHYLGKPGQQRNIKLTRGK